MVDSLTKGAQTVAGVGDEWVVSTTDAGPSRFLPPDQLDPLLRASERSFSRLLAIDSRGRWIFRDDSSRDALSPSIRRFPTRSRDWRSGPSTRAIRPVGTNRIGRRFRVANRVGSSTITIGSRWTRANRYRLIFPPILYPPAATTAPASTAPDTTAQNGPLLLVDSDGNRYYDGQSTLTVVPPRANGVCGSCRINAPGPPIARPISSPICKDGCSCSIPREGSHAFAFRSLIHNRSRSRRCSAIIFPIFNRSSESGGIPPGGLSSRTRDRTWR